MAHRFATTALASFAFTACLQSTEPAAATVESTVFASSLDVNLAASTRTPSGLYYRDLTVGTGTTLAVGQTVGVYYVGSLSNGTTFDQLKAPATPLSFRIGSGQVIAGFDEGVRGMKVGGRRQLLIPPDLAYGSRDTGAIPGNSVIVFVVDAVSVQGP